MSRQITTICLIILLLFHASHISAQNYVHEACSVTRYKTICVKTLASYSNKARRSPKRWARAGVSVTIGEVKMVAQYVNNLNKRHDHATGRQNRAALYDCVENVQGTLQNLHKSLYVLRRLSYEGFNEHMNDVLTWLSAALTDLDTCLDGFEGKIGNEISRLIKKVQNASFITSNALALANKLATNGDQNLGDEP